MKFKDIKIGDYTKDNMNNVYYIDAVQPQGGILFRGVLNGKSSVWDVDGEMMSNDTATNKIKMISILTKEKYPEYFL